MAPRWLRWSRLVWCFLFLYIWTCAPTHISTLLDPHDIQPQIRTKPLGSTLDAPFRTVHLNSSSKHRRRRHDLFSLSYPSTPTPLSAHSSTYKTSKRKPNNTLPVEPPHSSVISHEEFNNAVLACHFPKPKQSTFTAFALESTLRETFDSKAEACMFLAHAIHETSGFKFHSELATTSTTIRSILSSGTSAPYKTPSATTKPTHRRHSHPSKWNKKLRLHRHPAQSHKSPPTYANSPFTRFDCGLNHNEACPVNGYPGKSYHGRGPLQLTHSSNYASVSWHLFRNDILWKNPELLEDERVGFAASLDFWKTSVKPFSFSFSPRPQLTLRPPPLQFGYTTWAIHSSECTKPPLQHLAKRRFAFMEKVRMAMGIGGGEVVEGGCYLLPSDVSVN